MAAKKRRLAGIGRQEQHASGAGQLPDLDFPLAIGDIAFNANASADLGLSELGLHICR